MREEIKKADIVLIMTDAATVQNFPPGSIVIRNKIDLINEQPSIKQQDGVTLIYLSAKTGEGIALAHNQEKDDKSTKIFINNQKLKNKY